MAEKGWQTWVWVKWRPGVSPTAWETWKDHPQIMSAWSTPGEWDCVLAVKPTDPQMIEDFVWKELRKNEWVEHTHTTLAKQWW